MTAASEISSALDKVKEAASTLALAKDLPLIGDELKGVTQITDFITALANDIQTALAANPTAAAAIAAAINAAAIPGVAATVSGDFVDIALTIADTQSIAPTNLDLSLGGSGLGLAAKADFAIDVETALNLTMRLDTADPANPTLKMLDNRTDDISFSIKANIENLSASAKLGPIIGINLTEKDAADAAPELELTLTADLSSSVTPIPPAGFDFDDLTVKAIAITGGVDFGVSYETTPFLGAAFLPKFSGDIGMNWTFGGTDTAAPEVKLTNLAVDIGSLASALRDLLGPVFDFLDLYPVGEVIDAITEPLPLIGGLVNTPLGPQLDRVKDGVLNMLDIMGQGDKANEAQLTKFAQALVIIKQVQNIVDQPGGKIMLGNALFTDTIGATGTGTFDPKLLLDPIAAADRTAEELGLLEEFQAIKGAFTEVLGFVKDNFPGLLPKELDPESGDKSGVSFPIIDNPSSVLKLLFPKLFGNEPVKFIEFDIPALTTPDSTMLGPYFIPVLGPIGITLSGGVAASIDFQFGYDSTGLATGKFIDGIYITTMPEGTGYKPLATLSAEFRAGVGIGGFGVALAIEGGLGARGDGDPENETPFDDPVKVGFDPALNGVVRLEDFLDGACLFGNGGLEGIFTADVSGVIRIGFGFFKWEKRLTFVETTLFDFSYDCQGGKSDAGFGIAHVDGPNLVLNAGPDAGLRKIGGIVGIDDSETFKVATAKDRDGVLIPGTLTVNYKHIAENYAAPAGRIIANMGNQNDAAVLEETIAQGLDAHGGAGDDLLQGGAGADNLFGEGDGDALFGKDGADMLDGGAGDDTLEGGKGGDVIKGGAGFDQVSYENSAAGVEFTVGADYSFVGSGGDAEGDVVSSVEYIIGSNFRDVIRGAPVAYEADKGNTIEGRGGDDDLFGGAGRDFLLGGAGRDVLYGFGARDATSYLTSWGAVSIDLFTGRGLGGDAEGDRLFDIEDVQGSFSDDVLVGRADAANGLDGWLGNDVIDGAGGFDTITGDQGDDIVFGYGTGATLDGGGDTDELTFVNLTSSAINANLETGSASHILFLSDTIVKDGVYSTFENLTGTDIAGDGDALAGDGRGNIMKGLAGDDQINGGDGDDHLIGGFGADTITGGNGFDWVEYEDSFEGVFVNLLGGGAFGTASGDTYGSVENVLGSLYGDILLGDAAANIIDPNISGRFAVETVNGGAGFETDTLRVNYSRVFDGVNAVPGKGVVGGYDLFSSSGGSFVREQASSSATLDSVTFGDIERLDVVGTNRADTIYGGQGHDRIHTGRGADTIYAGTGNDDVHADSGRDVVFYGTGSDRQLLSYGGTYDDSSVASTFHLDGGRGIDMLSISLGGIRESVTLVGGNGLTEYNGRNLFGLNSGAAVENFEILGDAITGSGNDAITQTGRFDNTFNSGDGSDRLTPGLGLDTVDGGSDLDDLQFSGFADGLPIYQVDADSDRLYAKSGGDLLVLDYSSLEAGDSVSGITGISDAGFIFYDGDDANYNVITNSGFYSTSQDELTFSNIERIHATGSSGDDTLAGTEIPFDKISILDGAVRGSSRGDDILKGGAGNDELYGYSGSDLLEGGEGDDILDGAAVHLIIDDSGFAPGLRDENQLDTLTGGRGGDLFVLGSTDGVYYTEGGNFSDSDAAIITDFNATEGDRIRLSGDASEYGTFLTEDGRSTIIYQRGFDGPDNAIAALEGVTDFSLTGSYVEYVGGGGFGGRMAGPDDAPTPEMARLFSSITPALAPVAVAAPVAPPLAPTDWVIQTTNTDALKASFTTRGGTVTIEGDAESFGTFTGDPFGLGSGVILSTGVAEELPGENTSGGATVLRNDIPLTFVKVGRVGETDIFRADLTGIGINIKSILLNDSNSGIGGAPGAATGFDLDFVKLSTTKLLPFAGELDLNSSAILPSLDVFDFSAAGITFEPGSQRGAAALDLLGATGKLVLDAGHLALRDAAGSGPDGNLSLGDGGSIGFDLTRTVSTSGPLYLYVGEDGASGETLVGSVSASSDTVEPTGDLSTDLGAEGPDGDAAKFTYRFTPGTGENRFSIDAVLFTEEFPEFSSEALGDIFSVKLNGIEVGALSNGGALTLNSMVYSGSGDLIGNMPGTGPLADAIKADAYTKLLTIGGAVREGVENVLTIEVKDGRDAFLDSGILIKGDSFTTFVGTGGANIAPVIDAPPGEIGIDENTKAVTTITAADADAGQTISFAIRGGADASLFDIDAATGALSFKDAPNFEKPEDAGGDNVYNVIVEARDNGGPALSDFEEIKVRVLDAPEPTSLLKVTFLSEDTAYKNSFGWYDSTTGKGGMLFPNVEAQGARPPLTPGVSATGFTVPTESLNDISFFIVPNGAGISSNTRAELTGKIALVQNPNGLWAVAAADAAGNVIRDASGAPSYLNGAGAFALFSETSKNQYGADYASSVAGTSQTPAALAGDTADGPTGLMAWDDRSVLGAIPTGADYDDAVFLVSKTDGLVATGTTGNDGALKGTIAGDVIYGLAGNDTITGLAGNDWIEGGAGADSLFGQQGADTFAFRPGFGKDIVRDFKAAGSDHDFLRISKDIFPSFATAADLLASGSAAQVGTDVVITADAFSSITLKNVSLALLAANPGDILLV